MIMAPRILETKETPCYCGGIVRQVLTRDKRTPYGWKWNHYKKPRWQIDNCYPKVPEKSA